MSGTPVRVCVYTFDKNDQGERWAWMDEQIARLNSGLPVIHHPDAEMDLVESDTNYVPYYVERGGNQINRKMFVHTLGGGYGVVTLMDYVREDMADGGTTMMNIISRYEFLDGVPHCTTGPAIKTRNGGEVPPWAEEVAGFRVLVELWYLYGYGPCATKAEVIELLPMDLRERLLLEELS